MWVLQSYRLEVTQSMTLSSTRDITTEKWRAMTGVEMARCFEFCRCLGHIPFGVPLQESKWKVQNGIDVLG